MNFFTSNIFLCLAVVLDATTSAEGKAINSYAGPYFPVVTRAYSCEDEKNLTLIWSARTSHYNPQKPMENQRYTGFIKIKQPLNDSYWITVLIDRRNNNQWKENAFVMRFPTAACTAAVVNTPWFIKLSGKLYKGNHPCLITEGQSDFDYPLYVSFPNVPIMPYGEFRFRVIGNLIGRKDHALCLAADCWVYPKI